MPEREWQYAYPLAKWLPEVSLLCKSGEVEVLRRALKQLQDNLTSAEGGARNTREAAEECTFLGLAPHLESAEFFSELIARPHAALDVITLEEWFAALPEISMSQAIEIIHSPPDDVTLLRTLWFLSSAKPSLFEKDRQRLAILARSPDHRVRGAAMRFCCMSGDEELARCIVDLGDSFLGDMPSWDAKWGARLLISYSSHLPFEKVAARLHPVDAGYALHRRGCNSQELQTYVSSLNQHWYDIVSASDPDIQKLPVIIARDEERELGTGMPSFESRTFGGVILKNPSTTWRALHQDGALENLFPDPEKVAQELTRLAAERVAAISAAWQTDALRWYGRSFNRPVLKRIYEEFPDLVSCWIEPALGSGPTGRTARIRLATFLTHLCPLLLEHDPEKGLALWHAMRNEWLSPAKFDAAYVAFEAIDSSGTEAARREVLADCNDDHAISQLAYVAHLFGREEWLRLVIARMLTESPLYMRAKALALASYSITSVEQFETYVAAANVKDSWVEDRITDFRANVEKNAFACHWYSLFLTSDDQDVSWGALQLFLGCADERFFLWRRQHEDETPQTQRKLKFLRSGFDLERELNHERGRKDTLFGIKIERGEVFPFIDL